MKRAAFLLLACLLVVGAIGIYARAPDFVPVDAFSEERENRDGSFTRRIHQRPVNYLGEDGEWYAIKDSPWIERALAASSTFSPAAAGGATNDCVVGFSGTSRPWNDVVTNAGSLADNNSAADSVSIVATSTTNQFSTLYRFGQVYPTATLADDITITDATITIVGTSKTNGLGLSSTYNIYSFSPASDSTCVSGDYATGGTTAFATAITYAGWNSAGTNVFTFNTDGKAAISLTGNSKFMLREATHDVANVSPSWTSNASTSISFNTADHASNDPVLTVTYTTPGGVPKTIIIIKNLLRPLMPTTFASAT